MGESHVLHGIDFEFRAGGGDPVGLNGAGKTTDERR